MKILKNILRILVIMMFLFILFNIFGSIYSKIAPKIDIKSANSFYLYDKNNSLIYYGSSNNDSWIDLENMGDYVVKATLSAEDKKFYLHKGFNFPRIAKAMYENIKMGEIVQGASTISQQYARNLFLDFDKTWQRKWKEMWITFSLEYNYSKDEILEGYLNTINYGHGCYGISSAAKFYFNKNVDELSLGETTILVGIPNSPSDYSPIPNLELAKERQKIILNRMVENGYITKEEKDKTLNEEIVLYGKYENHNLTTLTYYQDAVMDELKNIPEIPKDYIETKGIKIYTTLDLEAQEALEKGIKENTKTKDIQTSKVMIDTNTGGILGLVGGISYQDSTYNRATSSLRQPGSTVKPFLYYKALENGFTASSTFLSERTTFYFDEGKSYSPSNSGNVYANKEISMAAAMSFSDNIYAIKTHLFLGQNELVNILKDVGITSPVEETLSAPLGTYEVNIIELANAYGILANGGKKTTPHFITKITDINDNVLYEYKDEEEQILDQSLTFIISELLTGSYDSSFIDYTYPTCINIMSNLTNRYALKSGSTDTDAWVIGYNKDIVLATWSGYDDNTKIPNDVVVNNKKSWAISMEDYLKNKESNWYSMPDDVVGVLVNPITGILATNEDVNKKILYYIKGTEPFSNKEYNEIDDEIIRNLLD